jgi:hypothetical protein
VSDVGDLAYGDLVLRLDGSVIELLMISRDGSYRTHANHAQVSLKPTKQGDEVEVRIGTNYRQEGRPSGPIVTDDDVHAPWGPFKVPIAEQDRLLELFAEAERRRVPVLGAVSY